MNPANPTEALTPAQQGELLGQLATRFARHASRHQDLDWATVQARLETAPTKVRSLYMMEATGGEPDVVGFDRNTCEYIFADCSPQTPAGRVSLCYDRAALAARKTSKPAGSAVELAAAMGVELLTEQQYLGLQELGEFDTKSSSWLQTPPGIRSLGGAIFGDRRFGRVFIYHNGAGSYYRARGFRGSIRV